MLINGDCLIELKKIPDNSIDLIVTSPPYNVGIDYDSYNDKKPYYDYLNWCKKWLQECFRILKYDGKCCINHYINYCDLEKINRFPIMDIRQIQELIGFNVCKLIIWDDKTLSTHTAWGSWLSASSPYIQTPYEGILISSKKYWKKQNKGISTISKKDFMEGVSGIWKIGTTRGKTPATFPEKLPKICIELLTYENDTVLDPFMGSGTTGVVCKKLKRNFIGIEISKNYFNIAKERICEEQKTL